MRKRLRRIHRLYDSALAYVLSLNADYVLNYIVKNVGEILELDHCYVMLADDDSGELYVQASWASAPDPALTEEVLVPTEQHNSVDEEPLGKPSYGRRLGSQTAQAAPMWTGTLEALVVQSQSPMLIPDTTTFPDFPVTKRLKGHMPRSMVGIPILFREKVIGTLTAASWAQRSFAPDEVVALTQLAVPASLAVENERLYINMQERLREKEVLLEGTKAMSGMQETDRILAALAAQMARVMEDAWCGLLLVEGERVRLHAHATWDVTNSLEAATCQELGLRAPGNRGETIQEEALQEDEHPPIASSATAKRVLSSTEAVQMKISGARHAGDPLVGLARRHGCVAASAVPLIHQNRTLGLAVVGLRQRGDGFREGDYRILQALANQAALAIENAQLLAHEKRQSEERALLLEAARLAASTLDLADAMDDFAEVFSRCLQADQCLIFHGGSRPGLLEWNASYGIEPAQVDFFRALSLDPKRDALCGNVFDSGQPRIAMYLQEEPMGPTERILATACDAMSAAIWPLRSQAPTAGLAILFFRRSRPLNPAQCELMDGLVRQAAIFMRNATLYREARVRAERLQALSDITEGINATRDLPSIFSIVARNTQKIVPVDWTGLAMIDRENNIMRFPAMSFSDTDGPSAPQSFPLETSLVFRAARDGRPIICDDLVTVRSPLEKHLYESGIRSMLVIPMLVDREAVATLNLGNRQPAAFSSDHVEILQEMADHLATAIKNANMFEEITRMNQELRRMDAVKSDFLSTVAHDIRTPLTIIKGYLFVLLKPQGLSSFVVESLETIDSQTDHLKELIENLLSLSRLESNKGLLQPNLQEVSLSHLADEIVSNFKLAARKKEIKLLADVPKNAVVSADRGMLVRVFYNLVGNALKFTHQGSITIRARMQDGSVLCQVADTGAGIAPEHKNRIFERFYKVDHPDQRAPSGTGLGLAIVETIIGAHGGRIWVESELGVGTTFSFVLPLVPPTMP